MLGRSTGGRSGERQQTGGMIRQRTYSTQAILGFTQVHGRIDGPGQSLQRLHHGLLLSCTLPCALTPLARLLLQLCVGIGESRVGSTQGVCSSGLVSHGSQLIGHETHKRTLLVAHLRGVDEVERHRTDRPVRRFQRRREQVHNLHEPSLGHGNAAGAITHAHAQRTDPRPIRRRPFVLRHGTEQLAVTTQLHDERKLRAKKRRHTIERKLLHITRLLGEQERVRDLTYGQQLTCVTHVRHPCASRMIAN
jgi:hypothetical protein